MYPQPPPFKLPPLFFRFSCPVFFSTVFPGLAPQWSSANDDRRCRVQTRIGERVGGCLEDFRGGYGVRREFRVATFMIRRSSKLMFGSETPRLDIQALQSLAPPRKRQPASCESPEAYNKTRSRNKHGDAAADRAPGVWYTLDSVIHGYVDFARISGHSIRSRDESRGFHKSKCEYIVYNTEIPRTNVYAKL